jgi:lipopolysaccharide/colanic/teichoic acid biosynthesis glycosyltransferase
MPGQLSTPHPLEYSVEPLARAKVRPTSGYAIVKRAIDLVAVLVSAPITLAIVSILALLVRLDGGHAFYSQRRLGKDGRVFVLWKLRSMVPDAERRLEEYLAQNPEARLEWDLTQKLRRDPRITWLGHYLRKYSADELPQLWNVFLGQMSLVGPRPMSPEQRPLYPETAYFDMRPGLTGLWQIGERNGCSFAQRAAHDTQYAKIMSLGTDIRILLMTAVVVVRGTGL